MSNVASHKVFALFPPKNTPKKIANQTPLITTKQTAAARKLIHCLGYINHQPTAVNTQQFINIGTSTSTMPNIAQSSMPYVGSVARPTKKILIPIPAANKMKPATVLVIIADCALVHAQVECETDGVLVQPALDDGDVILAQPCFRECLPEMQRG